VLQGLAVLNGLGGGLNAGAIGAVSAATLPDVENSARDMNILVTGPVFGQMALQAGGGYVIGWASDKWSPAVAWSVMWCATSSRVDASFGVYRCLSSFLISLVDAASTIRRSIMVRIVARVRRLVSGAFFLLAVPTLIPIRPMQQQLQRAMIQAEDAEEKKSYRKAHDYRRGGIGGRY
jgi:hypothetical protein